MGGTASGDVTSPRGPALRDLIRSYQQRAGITDETGTQA